MVYLGYALRAAAGLPSLDAPSEDPRFHAFRTLTRRWQHLRQAVQREGKRRGDGQRIPYVACTEVHRSGWPHLNLLLESHWLADALLEEHGCPRVAYPGIRCGVAGCARDWLSDRAVSCGFGPVVFLEVARSSGQDAAHYMLKLAGELEGAAGKRRRPDLGRAAAEVVKFSQAPVNAPPHFRRLRAARGMLDPPKRNPDMEGALCGQPASRVQAAIDADLDLVDVTDGDTGEVTRLPFTARGPPPLDRSAWAPPDWAALCDRWRDLKLSAERRAWAAQGRA